MSSERVGLLICPRWAAPGRIRLWVGARARTAPPALAWVLDGEPASPSTEIQALGSVRPANLLDGNPPRVFSGLYEFSGLESGRRYRVRVTATDGDSTEIDVRTPPTELPAGVDDWLNVLLVSCYHFAEATPGVLDRVLAGVKKEARIDLTMLLGDQVYLDLPTLQNFPDDARWLAEKFEEDYERNWFEPGGFSDVLRAAPSVSIPDDHEYWNNFPHTSPFIENTYTLKGRERWRAAALAMWQGFQAAGPGTRPVIVAIPPVSICVADSRTERDPGLTTAFAPQGLIDVRKWVDRLEEHGWFGIFATGQSLFDKAATGATASVGDRTLANYGDFGDLVRSLTRLSKPLVCITGDVHWGRVLQVDRTGDGLPAIYEIITSPASLVTSVQQDPFLKVGAAVSSLFGSRNPWPRHSEPRDSDSYLAPDIVGGKRLHCERKHGQKGDQLTVLSLRRRGFGVSARITYYSIHSDGAVRAAQRKVIPEFDLLAGIQGG